MEYKTVHFMSADEKSKLEKDFRRFIESLVSKGFEESEDAFTKRVYEHLHVHCGFIAHNDKRGFYVTYFNGDIDRLRAFLGNFINLRDISPGWENYRAMVERYHDYGDYEDINNSMIDILLDNINSLLAKAYDNTREEDINHIKFLMKKHGLQEVKI